MFTVSWAIISTYGKPIPQLHTPPPKFTLPAQPQPVTANMIIWGLWCLKTTNSKPESRDQETDDSRNINDTFYQALPEDKEKNIKIGKLEAVRIL